MSETKWQPIETAPRDGSVFIACNLDHPTFGSWPMMRRVRHGWDDQSNPYTQDMGAWLIVGGIEPDTDGYAPTSEPEIARAMDKLNTSVRYGWTPLPTPQENANG